MPTALEAAQLHELYGQSISQRKLIHLLLMCPLEFEFDIICYMNVVEFRSAYSIFQRISIDQKQCAHATSK